MNPMDRVTVHALVAWAVFIGVPLAGMYAVHRLWDWRQDRARAAETRRPGLSDEAVAAAFREIAARFNDAPLDEILDGEGEQT